IQDLNIYRGESPSGSTASGGVLLPRTGSSSGRSIILPHFGMVSDSTAWKWISLSLAVALILMIGAFVTYKVLNKPAAAIAPMTVIIADFDNHTGESIFTGTLESSLKLVLQGASFINAYDRTRLSELGAGAVTGTLDSGKAQTIAANQGLNVMVSGTLDRIGSGYKLGLSAVQIVTGKTLVSETQNASGKDQVLSALTKLGEAVRKALGDSGSDSSQRLSMETLSATSLEAVHEYAAALDLLSQGKREDALKHFSEAVNRDQNFGLAYAGMAAAYHNLGRGQEAEKSIKLAITKIDQMTERERFRTRAFLYLQTGNQQKCGDEYAALLSKYPSDTGALNNMAICSAHLRQMPKAVEDMQRVNSILPKRATYHVNLSVYAAYAGDFQTAAKEAAATLQLNPSYTLGLQAQAFANLAQDQITQAGDAYRTMEKKSPSEAAIGLADLAIYEGRYRDAASLLAKGAEADTAARERESAADKSSALAYPQLLRGDKAAAMQAADKALGLSETPKTRFVAGRVFAALGETARAQTLADGLSKELPIEAQTYGELILGEIALKKGDSREAVQLFTKAKGVLDTWIGRFDLGRAYLEARAF